MSVLIPTRSTLSILTVSASLLLLTSCSILGSNKPEDAFTRYDPVHAAQADASWPRVDWQLALTEPEVTSAIDTLRIVVRPTPNELEVYQGARWAKLPSNMVLDGLLQTLEDSGKIKAVARQGSGISAQYRLVLELRRFESEYMSGSSMPSAVISLNAKLLHVTEQEIVASRTFEQVVPASSPAVADVVAAFETGLTKGNLDLAGWILTEGQRSEQRPR